jgi:hypothetical protein
MEIGSANWLLWEHPGLVLATTWLLGLGALLRLVVGPAPGAAPVDVVLLGAVLLWAMCLVSAQAARRRRAADLDAAIADALAQARRVRTHGATMNPG